MPKERIEVFGGGRCAVIDDFREAVLHEGDTGTNRLRPGAQDKGQKAMLLAWLAGLRSGTPALPPETALAVSAATIGAVESMSIGQPLPIGPHLWSTQAQAEDTVSEADAVAAGA